MSSKMAAMPNIAIPRSRFKQNFNHVTSFKHGKVVPIDCFEVIPGDTISLNLASLVRMSNPIVPLFSNIKCRIDAFFVPMRLIWDDTEKFYGDPSNHNKIQTLLPVDFDETLIPCYDDIDLSDDTEKPYDAISAYLGKPLYDASTAAGSALAAAVGHGDLHISCLKERAYYEIFNEYYRPSALSLPYLINKGNVDTGIVAVSPEGYNCGYDAPVLSCFKGYDYFTAGTLAPQYGEEVVIPFATKYAAVEMASSTILDNGINHIPSFAVSDAVGADPKIAYPTTFFTPDVVDDSLDPAFDAGGEQVVASLRAKLPNGIAAINTIRYCFQLQKFLERSNYGNLFYQQLNAHYGVTSPDGRLQRPDHLGKAEFYINVNQVLSTAGAADDANTKLGQPGAVSVTGNKSYLFTASFTEPGYVMILLETKVERDYASGILREDLKRNRLEFYTPEFANLGDQATKRIELQVFAGKITPSNAINVVGENEVISYQEHWAEYRYRKNLVTGIISPDIAITTAESSLPVWSAADSFNNVSTEIAHASDQDARVKQNDAFLREDRLWVKDRLVTGIDGPDYIADFHFDYISTRELPLYSIPGLIDHFGAL